MYFTPEVTSPGVYLSWSLAGGGATGGGHLHYCSGHYSSGTLLQCSSMPYEEQIGFNRNVRCG
jgi:hypothetical protein